MKKQPELPRREGFWRSGKKSHLPMPVGREKAWAGKKAFLKKFREVEAQAGKAYYKGWSTCRLCGDLNGSIEYSYKGWVWPAGYAHYIKAHNVRPSLAFQDFVLGEFVK